MASGGAQIVALFDAGADPDEALLDRVFFALSDPVRRAIPTRSRSAVSFSRPSSFMDGA